MLSRLFFICLLFKAAASQISVFGDRTADYGGEAHYKCKLDDPKGVLQVTWQRIFKDDSIENLATYSKRFGEQVNEQYQGKITFTEVSLESTSITVGNLTWADESCYVCSFNAYPDGSKRHQTCLTVEGVSEVKTQVYVSNDEPKDEVNFRCSATGKPAPKIQWDPPPQAVVVGQSQTTVLTNGDRTFTSSRNITLQLSPDWDGHVDCLINAGMRGEKKETIIFTRKKDEQMRPFYLPIIISLIVFAIILAAVSVHLVLKRKKHPPSNPPDML